MELYKKPEMALGTREGQLCDRSKSDEMCRS